jgi:hypothetical protein
MARVYVIFIPILLKIAGFVWATYKFVAVNRMCAEGLRGPITDKRLFQF